jgi:dolichyl-phosphate beta-glucosyltransferase
LNSPYRFIFVDDGSSDGTRRFLENNVKPPNYCLFLESNSGKAEAVRRGMLFLKSLNEYNSMEWAGFWDADMAAPVSEVGDFLSYSEFYGNADAIYGSRIMRCGSVIKRRLSRHILGRIYCTIISILFGLKCYDTQCGAKLFRKAVLGAAFNEPFVSNWVFDVEIILRLKEFKQIEYPLKYWEDIKGSKISPLKALPGVAADICRIYRKYRNHA